MDLKLVKTKDIKDLKNALIDIQENNKRMAEEWLNNKDAAKFLNMSIKTLYRYRIKRLIPYAKRERLVFYKKSDLITFIEEHYKMSTIK